MSSGTSLYRRHRPRTFADVVGQEHVVRTLRNAVERDKVHHAYLFVGSRGTGKTSMAKILAACLNCENGPTVAPCGQCGSCLSIANATSLDVIEMDAASNNSVDDIRDLRERVAFAPVSGRHKVYILDEAHMLSSQAWNAFLKTLEEPPPRTIFVLATTEAQKVLATVVDRCQRFDFGRPSAEQVAKVLARVTELEHIDAADGALALIARHATGSFRDALGTLEQLVTYVGERTIEPSDVLAVLGVADDDLLFGAVEAIIARDPGRAMRTAARLGESGRDPGQVLRDLEVHGRELLTVQVLGEVPPEVRVTPERDRRLIEQAQCLSRTDAVRLLDLVAAAIEATSNGAQPRIQLELLLAKAAAPQTDPSVAALLARIEQLERANVGEDPVAVPPPSPPGAPSRPRHTARPQPGAADPGIPHPGGSQAGAADPGAPEPRYRELGTPEPGAREPGAPQPGARTPEPGAPESGALDSRAPESGPAAAPEPGPPAPTSPGPGEPSATPAAQLTPAPSTPQPGALTLERAVTAWPAVVDLIRNQNTMLAALLADAQPVAITERELSVAFAPGADFLKRKAEQDEHRRAVGEALHATTGYRLNVRYVLGDAQPVSAAPHTALLSGEELVRRFLEEFDAEEILDDEHHEAEAQG